MGGDKKRYLFEVALVILVLVAGWFGVKLPNAPIPEPVPWVEVEDSLGMGTRSAVGRAIQFDRDIRMAQDLAVVGASTLTGNVAIAGTTSLTGALAADGGITVDTSNFTVSGTTGAVTTASTLRSTGVATLGGLILSSTAITPTAGQVIAPSNGLYIVNSSGAVSMTLGVPSAAGQVLYLYGDDANTVTVNDTRIRTTDGNAVTFGQYDVVQWISTATEWIHVAKSANQ